MLDCNLIVLGTKVLLETAIIEEDVRRNNYALKVFTVDDNFQRSVLDYLSDNKDINILNKASFNFLT